MKSFLFSLLLSCTTVQSQTYSRIISDKEIIGFMKWDLNKDSISGKKSVGRKIFAFDKSDFILADSNEIKRSEYSLSTYLFKKKNHLDSLFSMNDTRFFIDQVETTATNWQFSLPNIILKNRSGFHPKKPTFYYSLPFFSVDRNTVIIKEAFHCGLLCGGGAIYIYKRRSVDDWVFIKKINEWAE